MSLFEILDGPDKTNNFDDMISILYKSKLLPDDLAKIKAGYKRRIPNYIMARALMLDYGYGIQKDTDKAYKIYKMLAHTPDRDARIGYMLLSGRLTKNYTKAKKYLELAVATGHIWSKNNLGVLYYDGLGVPKNYELAFILFEESKNTSATAKLNLGKCYYYGNGVAQNTSKAIIYFEAAGRVGYGFLGARYITGDTPHIPKDIDKGIMLMLKSGQPEYTKIITENINIILKWFRSKEINPDYMAVLADDALRTKFNLDVHTRLVLDLCIDRAQSLVELHYEPDGKVAKECAEHYNAEKAKRNQLLKSIVPIASNDSDVVNAISDRGN